MNPLQRFMVGALVPVAAAAMAADPESATRADASGSSSSPATSLQTVGDGEGVESQQKQASRLKAHEPSYMIYRHAQGDENALRVKYSLRYDLRPEFENRKWAVDLKYTGLFDFYTGTRPSGPVINRLSNIGLHWRQDSDVSLYGGQWRLQWYDIGVEHRSNGQTTDMRSEADFETARQAYARGDHRFFDGVSRGSNYLSAETRAQHSDKRLALYLKTKLYITSDNAVRWGPQSQQGLDISDFDRFTVGWTYTSKPELEEEKHRFLSVGDSESSLYWTVGDKGPRLSSLDLDYMRITRIEKWDISLPVYVRIHWGPMNNLSNYSERQTSIGVGFKFSPRW